MLDNPGRVEKLFDALTYIESCFKLMNKSIASTQVACGGLIALLCSTTKGENRRWIFELGMATGKTWIGVAFVLAMNKMAPSVKDFIMVYADEVHLTQDEALRGQLAKYFVHTETNLHPVIGLKQCQAKFEELRKTNKQCPVSVLIDEADHVLIDAIVRGDKHSGLHFSPHSIAAMTATVPRQQQWTKSDNEESSKTSHASGALDCFGQLLFGVGQPAFGLRRATWNLKTTAGKTHSSTIVRKDLKEVLRETMPMGALIVFCEEGDLRKHEALVMRVAREVNCSANFQTNCRNPGQYRKMTKGSVFFVTEEILTRGVDYAGVDGCPVSIHFDTVFSNERAFDQGCGRVNRTAASGRITAGMRFTEL